MERLTLDHPQTNVETARNLFYIKDRETWVRGGGPEPDYEDVPLYDWVRRIIETHGLEIDVSDNDNLSHCLYERLFDCVDTVEGVVAHLYTAAWALSELREKLKVYEDKLPFDRLDEAAALVKARDEGRAVVLPCKVGEWLYYLLDDKVRKAKVEEIQCSANKHNPQFDVTVFAWDFSAKEQLTYCPAGDSWTDNSRGFVRVFLTRAEAEAALGGGGDDA